jgi:hypothetical protein
MINFAPNSTGKVSYDKRVGVTAHTNTKYKGVMNMRYWINQLNVIRFRDVRTLNELKSFVRYPNGTWSARKEAGVFDDRVMSLIWSLIPLEGSITEKYYEIIRRDDNGKPLIIKGMDYGVKDFVNPLSMYSNEKEVGLNNPNPVVFGSTEQSDDDISQLEQMGWRMMGNRPDTGEDTTWLTT